MNPGDRRVVFLCFPFVPKTFTPSMPPGEAVSGPDLRREKKASQAFSTQARSSSLLRPERCDTARPFRVELLFEHGPGLSGRKFRHTIRSNPAKSLAC